MPVSKPESQDRQDQEHERSRKWHVPLGSKSTLSQNSRSNTTYWRWHAAYWGFYKSRLIALVLRRFWYRTYSREQTCRYGREWFYQSIYLGGYSITRSTYQCLHPQGVLRVLHEVHICLYYTSGFKFFWAKKSENLPGLQLVRTTPLQSKSQLDQHLSSVLCKRKLVTSGNITYRSSRRASQYPLAKQSRQWLEEFAQTSLARYCVEDDREYSTETWGHSLRRLK